MNTPKIPSEPCWRLVGNYNGKSGVMLVHFDEVYRTGNWSSIGRGYATREECVQEERVITCVLCGKEDGTNYSNGDTLRKNCTCFNCDFWLEKVQWGQNPSRSHRCVRIAGEHYCYDEASHLVEDRSERDFLGHGGHLFRIRFTATGEDVQVNNLWSQGRIPEHFRSLLPDNAVFVPLS